MEERKTLSYIHLFMCGFNLIIVYYIAHIMSDAIYRICRGMEAKEFLTQIPIIPEEPGMVMAGAVISYLLLLCVIALRRTLSPCYRISRICLAAMEIVLCIAVMRTINMSYDGVVLLVIADLLDWFKGRRQRILFYLFMIAVYILSDYHLISAWLPLVPFESYLFYYNNAARGLLGGMKSVMTSVNVMAFILYVVIMIQNERQENERITFLNNQLNAANEQLKRYALESEKMAETRERNRLAREIHDTLGHALTGISAGIDACLAIIDISPEMTKGQLNRIGEVARQGIKDVRRSVSKLRPDALERLNLEDALTKMIEDISLTTNTKIMFDLQIPSLKFSPDEEDAVYRVVQEGITNAIRHGQATLIHITISKKDEWLTLMIRDNGCGCTEIKDGFGLKHMQERIGLLNGTIEYEGSDGFMITARIPIRWGEEYD